MENTIEKGVASSNDLEKNDFSSSSTYGVYEIDRCVKWITKHKFGKVTLQFPDDLLHISDKIAIEIQKRVLPSKVYILADTSYGSCCVDEVAAEHICADCIIHFGHACLTVCSRLPVLYVFGRTEVDVDNVVGEFGKVVQSGDNPGIFLFDVQFAHVADVLFGRLLLHFPNLVTSILALPDNNSTEENAFMVNSTNYLICGRRITIRPDVPLENHFVLYVGPESPTLNTFLLSLNRCPFYSYDHASARAQLQGADVNRSLRKRCRAIETARSAKIVGILMGTLGVAGYLDVVDRLKLVAKHASKRTYTIVVGHLNPEKLANFPEVDVFVLVACPENSLLDCKQFYKPIVTPHEFELACNREREWSMEVVTDFKELLPGAKHYVELPTSPDADASTDVSLITGRMAGVSLPSTTSIGAENALVSRNDVLTVGEIHKGGGGEFLANRSWQGLEQNLGQTPISVIHDGSKGIASGYEHEKSVES